jgi:hypothetical protein
VDRRHLRLAVGAGDHEMCKIYSKSPFMGRRLAKITRNSHPFATFVHGKNRIDNLRRSLFRNANASRMTASHRESPVGRLESTMGQLQMDAGRRECVAGHREENAKGLLITDTKSRVGGNVHESPAIRRGSPRRRHNRRQIVTGRTGGDAGRQDAICFRVTENTGGQPCNAARRTRRSEAA